MKNFIEKLALAFLAGGEQVAPIFVHSPHGLLIFNASEEFVAAAIAALNKPAVEPPPPAAPSVDPTR